jgi:hypothetical protein
LQFKAKLVAPGYGLENGVGDSADFRSDAVAGQENDMHDGGSRVKRDDDWSGR